MPTTIGGSVQRVRVQLVALHRTPVKFFSCSSPAAYDHFGQRVIAYVSPELFSMLYGVQFLGKQGAGELRNGSAP